MKFLLFCLCFSAVFLSAKEITIVKKRKPYAEIVTGAKPTRAVQFAAYELQHVVRLMTGATLPIVRTPSGKMLPFILGGAKKIMIFQPVNFCLSLPESVMEAGRHFRIIWFSSGYISMQEKRVFPAIDIVKSGRK